MTKLLTASLCMLAIGPSGPTLPICTMSAVPDLRDTATTYFVALALPDTVQTVAGLGPRGALSVASLSTPRGLKPRPDPNTRVFGQLVRIERVRGSRASEVAEIPGAGGRDAIVVPWGYQANCSPVLWTEGTQWVTPGTEGFYRAQLRPQSAWAKGLPTFDVPAAWQQPYPTGGRLQGERSRSTENSTEMLSPQELFELYGTLPDYESFERNPKEALVPVERWERANPRLARRWPATETLRMLRFLATYPR